MSQSWLIRKREFISYCWLFNIVYIHSFDCSLQMSPSKKFYYEIFLILFCVLPVTSSLFVSIYLFNLTRQKRNAESGGDTSAFKNKVKSLVFIFATTVWTSCSLLPYRIMNLARIHLFTWSELSCEGKQMMNWVAWILIYLLTINPIVNPLITSLIYAPYRTTIKKFLVNIPVGNRPFYSYQGEHLHQDCRLTKPSLRTLPTTIDAAGPSIKVQTPQICKMTRKFAIIAACTELYEYVIVQSMITVTKRKETRTGSSYSKTLADLEARTGGPRHLVNYTFINLISLTPVDFLGAVRASTGNPSICRDRVPDFASLRRNRDRRSSSAESAILRQSTEVVQISMGESCIPSNSPAKDFLEK
ncbi:hypothetical protein RB195_023466 [Necator americanus]|uniref:G-protein coupled receptors family 1 profile domain-containing protein n=1 Tax=Necator americanus TaxID=51031 RepID=A0ABR1EK69_NECAM